MHIMRKKFGYNLRRAIPILGIAGATMFGGCKKNNMDVPQHDTVYTFGIDDITQIWPADNVRASADSASVRYVILKLDGKSWRHAFNEDGIIYYYMNPMMDAVGKNNHKLRGGGTFVNLREENPESHKWLEDFGYSFVQTRADRSR